MRKVLDSEVFREEVKEVVGSISFEHDVDAAATIMSLIGREAAFFQALRKYGWISSKPLQDFGDFERTLELLKKEMRKIETATSRDFKLAERTVLFLMIPPSLLEKLSTLSNPAERRMIEFMISLFLVLPTIKGKKKLFEYFKTWVEKIGEDGGGLRMRKAKTKKIILQGPGSYLGMEKGCLVLRDRRGNVQRYPPLEEEIGEIILTLGNSVSVGALASLGF